MLAATPHLILDNGELTVPVPMIAPMMVCVVETGIPKCVAMKSVAAPADLRAKSSNWFKFNDFHPHCLHNTPSAKRCAHRHGQMAD